MEHDANPIRLFGKVATIAARIPLAKRATEAVAALVLLCLSTTAWAQGPLSASDVQLYRGAFQAAEADEWTRARQLASGAEDPLPAKVLQWLDLSRPNGTAPFQAIVAFLDANPDWPGTGTLRLRAENVLPPGLPAGEITAYFDKYPPLTFDSVMRYGTALEETGRAGEAVELIRSRWTDIPLTESQQARMLARFGAALTEADHLERLDFLLWRGRSSEARQMMPLVEAGQRRLAEARIRLAERSPGVDAAIEAVPPSLSDNEGLLYERARWRRYFDMTEGAIEILNRQPATLAEPERWWRERDILARRLFNDRDYRGAYELLNDHRQVEPLPVSEAEWFAGWLALRFLGDPSAAIGHFQTMYDIVGTPISLSRGAYWLGRAHEAAGNGADAENWYRSAAQYTNTFYGQLAAGELRLPTVVSLPAEPAVPPEATADFAEREFVRIVRALDQLGEDDLADTFLRRLASVTDDPIGHMLAGHLALELDRQHMAIRIAKDATRDGLVLTEMLYPFRPVEAIHPAADKALVFGLIRQESEFNIRAVSRAGALGLMQLMPATAQATASDLGIAHSTAMLTSDPAHNIRLGSAHMVELLDRFGGSYVVAAAAYNAGASRAIDWMARWGDPRGGAMDVYEVVDWIESLPFPETRNYIQRVLENTQVYRLRLGGEPELGGLERDLTR